MNKRRESLRVLALGALVLFLLRLIACFALGDKVSLFAQPELAAFLIKNETGRLPQNTRPAVTEPTAPSTTPTTQPTEPSTGSTEPSAGPEIPAWQPELPAERPVFTAEDMAHLQVTDHTARRPDIETLLTQPLRWDLTGDQPTVLIIHTHGTEAYTPTEEAPYKENGGKYRTNDETQNMISIGDELARLLEEAGIDVIHDRTPYDKNDYEDAYANSRVAVQGWLQKYPSICMVLDLHRDAAQYADGTQWASSCTINGQRAAQLMVVVGAGNNSLPHPHWEENMAIGEKLTVMFDRISDGVARELDLRAKRFNQDLSAGSLIVEVGAAGNTHEEAIRAMPVLAQAIISLSKGAN